MSKYTFRFTADGKIEFFCTFGIETEAALAAEMLLAERGYDADELVTGEWQDGRLLIWENESDAANDAGAKALCSVERC